MFTRIPQQLAFAFSSSISKLNTEPETTEEAIQRAEDHADAEWFSVALETVRHLCTSQAELTTDDVHAVLDMLDVETHDKRALGGVMRQAEKNGWCRGTDKYLRTKRKTAHRRPLMVWQSLIYSPSFS